MTLVLRIDSALGLGRALQQNLPLHVVCIVVKEASVAVFDHMLVDFAYEMECLLGTVNLLRCSKQFSLFFDLLIAVAFGEALWNGACDLALQVAVGRWRARANSSSLHCAFAVF